MVRALKLISLLSFIGFTGCTPLYVPTALNVPMFSGKGEFQGSVSGGVGLNAQTSYALTDHVGIVANYLYSNRVEDDWGKNHQAGEIALGYYTNFNDKWCFEVFSGYGLGKGSAFDSTYAAEIAILIPLSDVFRYEASGRYNKIYIQPSIGLKSGRGLIWNLSARISYVDFSRANIIMNEDIIWSGQTSRIFATIAGTLTVPLWNEKMFLRCQTGINIATGDTPPVYDYDFMLASVGLVFKLNPQK